jgi:hypothetical protein
MLKKSTVLNPPRRAIPQARPQRAKRRRGYNPHSCEPFAHPVDLGKRKSPSNASELRKSFWYVQPDRCENDAGKGASLGKEAVLPALGREGDIDAWVGRMGSATCSASSYVNQVHCENVAACPTLCPIPSTTFQMRAFSTRKRRPVEVILTPR